MLSIIITSFKEPHTIGRAIKSIANRNYSGIEGEFEIIQISPDKETLEAGLAEAKILSLEKNFHQIIDPHKGKPFALNLGFKAAKGEIVILTDGDVYFGENAVKELVKPFKSESVGGVTGQPIPTNPRNTFWGFVAHCFTAAADHKRRTVFTNRSDDFYISNKEPFPLSGYIFAIRNLSLTLPDNVILDDSYISYKVFNEDFRLAYAPLATAIVKFPTNLKDYVKQRRRNLAGHIDLKKHMELKSYKNDRSFLAELRYALFPLAYAKGIRELIWAMALYPLRLYTWAEVFYSRITKNPIMKKSGWERTESTK